MTAKIIIGILGGLFVILLLLTIYPIYVFSKLKFTLNKVKDIYMQIVYQLDVKYDLIQLNVENKDDQTLTILEEYNSHKKELLQVDLKKYNEAFNSIINKTKNKELINKCNQAQEKIDYAKEYYNEVVFSYNKYKENKMASYLSKAFLINDAKLY